jgi:hypothetical protein
MALEAKQAGSALNRPTSIPGVKPRHSTYTSQSFSDLLPYEEKPPDRSGDISARQLTSYISSQAAYTNRVRHYLSCNSLSDSEGRKAKSKTQDVSPRPSGH